MCAGGEDLKLCVRKEKKREGEKGWGDFFYMWKVCEKRGPTDAPLSCLAAVYGATTPPTVFR